MGGRFSRAAPAPKGSWAALALRKSTMTQVDEQLIVAHAGSRSRERDACLPGQVQRNLVSPGSMVMTAAQSYALWLFDFA
jgi:hypothetical protein